MDPLSLSASIIAVLQLAATLTSHINSIRHATSDQKKVAVEASNLYGLLTSLRFRVEDATSNDAWFNQVKLLGIDNGPLAQFKHILEKMVEQVSPSGTRDRAKSALMWKWTKSEVNDALKQMERLKTLISIALTNDTFTLSQAIHSEVIALIDQTSELQIGIEQLKTIASQDFQDKLSRWLQVSDPSSNYQAALAKRHADTGSWLLQSSRMQEWRDSTSSLLWLHGNAGCGKTVLSATALQSIFQDQDTQPDTIVAYFYFDFNSTENQHTRAAIRSLLFQLALQMPDLFRTLEHLYEYSCDCGSKQLSEDSIRSMLCTAFSKPRRKYIVLDALDECTERETLLPFINDIVVSPQYLVCILATSRRERDIEAELKPIAHHVMDIQSAQVNPDIALYVYDRLTADSKFKKWPANVKDEIANELMEKADGMFRWTYCQLESLRNCIKLSALRKALSSLPKTLDETYARMLQNIEANDQLSDAIVILQWLCISDRPLRLSEVVEVLAIERGVDGGFCPEERMPDPEDVMMICSSLISCSSIGEGREQRDIEVRLAHFSVKEYLLSDRCSMRSDFDEPVCQQTVAESCLHYLHYLGDQSSQADKEDGDYPLAQYAARNWWRHARKSGDLSGSTTLALTMTLLTQEDKLLRWVQGYNVDRIWEGYKESLTAGDLAPPLYYAAYIGILEAVSALLDEGAEVGPSGFSKTALQAASENGHEKIVQLLLEHGAEINARGGYHGTALVAASENGHEKVVMMLLENGAEVDASGGYHGTALRVASENGYEKIVTLLVGKGAKISASGQDDSSILIAIQRGHEKIATMLLEKSANTCPAWEYGSALHLASRYGYAKLVGKLLKDGYEINTQGTGSRNSALQAASAYGHEKVVQLLLENGAEVNAPGGPWYGTALEAALEYRHEKVVQTLLENGAETKALGQNRNVLRSVGSQGHDEMVQMPQDNIAELDVLRKFGKKRNRL